MDKIDIEYLKPNAFYWAKRADSDILEIVQVSTVFGSQREYLTAAAIGTDVHLTLEEFQFVEEILAPGLVSGIRKLGGREPF